MYSFKNCDSTDICCYFIKPGISDPYSDIWDTIKMSCMSSHIKHILLDMCMSLNVSGVFWGLLHLPGTWSFFDRALKKKPTTWHAFILETWHVY